MRRLGLDFETYSEANLGQVGTSRYARHPSTEVLMLAWAVDNGPVRQWVPAEGEDMPPELREMLADPDYQLFAWNKTFEWNILKHVLKIETPHERWRDVMVLAYSLALPGSLEKAGEVIGLPAEKKKAARGKLLIRKFCTPRKPTKTKPWTRTEYWRDIPAWDEFLAYNRQDVEAERAIWRKLRQWDMPPHEWDLWHIDQHINEAGLPINRRVVTNAILVSHAVVSRRLELMRRITGLANPNSVAQLLPWLQDEGYVYEDLKKGHVSRALEEAPPGDYARVLDLRSEVSRASVKKYAALEKRTDDDGLLRNTLQFAGAGRTMRWCLAEGSLVLVKEITGCVLEKSIETVSVDDLVWDGSEWVAHEGVVFSGDKQVITHDGVVATPEHIVYVSSTEYMPLGEAAEKGISLWRGEKDVPGIYGDESE